jgi:TAG lipase/steryl ester hydrolase/phospholipase A2/LPA acyltransferase
MRRTALTFIH